MNGHKTQEILLCLWRSLNNLVLKNHGTRAGGRGLKGGLINIPTDKQPLPWRRMEVAATPEQEMNISAQKSKDEVEK